MWAPKVIARSKFFNIYEVVGEGGLEAGDISHNGFAFKNEWNVHKSIQAVTAPSKII